MKKIQLVFALAATLVASVAVMANNSLATSYYKHTLSGARCTTAFTGTPCSGANVQCTVLEGSTTYYISKIVDSNPCEIVKKD